MSNPDCLVLCIENTVHSRMYIFYDSYTGLYEVRGKNDKNHRALDYQPYSFSCKSRRSLIDFIHYTLNDQDYMNLSLYNYVELPSTSVEVTFDLLNEYLDVNYEVFSFQDTRVHRRLLNILRSVTNYY